MGTLLKISGPVVVAQDVRGIQISELVKVGDLELLGEVISLKGERASIQVYEETGGLRPGEKVSGTGAPLSLELGPGLLSSVFDGIQRPLESIRKKSGDFIARGIAVPALDRKRRWEFIPVVKNGDSVHEGDVLGEVKEFSIIHKILVPPKISGKVTGIAKGSFTVTDEIAKVGGKPLTMLQKWPVRDPRPVKEKKHFEPPLVTGKRIVDTFFPIAKGGTAAIPGPFGSGKCVSGDTPMLLADGQVVPIKQVFEQVKMLGCPVECNELEEIHRSNGTISVFSFDGKKFVVDKPTIAYKGKSSRMIKIKTRSGKSVKVTPIHKLFVLDGDNIIEKPAAELAVGNYLVTPRKLVMNLKDQKIQTVELFSNSNLLSADENTNAEFRKVLKERLRQGLLERKYNNYLRKERLPPIKLMHNTGIQLNSQFQISRVKPKHGKIISVPTQMTPELAEFLGYVIADGNLHRSTYSVRFFNASSALLSRFVQLSEELFRISPSLSPHPRSKGSTIAKIDSKVVFAFMNALGIPYLSKARHAKIPSHVMRSSDASAAAFVSAYIACDGSIDVMGSRTEICSASRTILEELSFLLLRAGIVSSLEKEGSDGTARLWIMGKRNLETLAGWTTIIGEKGGRLKHAIRQGEWSSIDAIPITASVRLAFASNKLAYHLSNNKKIGVRTLQRLVPSMVGADDLKGFVELCSNVFFDEIKEIEAENGEFEVFDVEVPETHNFVGGHGPLLLHNTVNQTDLAKYADADIIVYCGCGERGNEMSEVLHTFPTLVDPKTKKPLMERTVLIANTSNMPVAAREASIYTSITIAEYYRDMGYDVALMADSTSRWAEAMREISGRMEEMPGEEGYPAYLGKRLAEFYERSGRVWCLGDKQKKSGSVSVVGAVSPPGGDLSEPVSQATLRVAKVFWALDSNLARRRHYPAINWLKSYSLYLGELREWFDKNVSTDFYSQRNTALSLLQKESELQNIVQLIGPDALPDRERLVLEVTKMIREDFLQQNSYDEADAYTTPAKQFWMLKTILHFHDKSMAALELDMPLAKILESPGRTEIAQLKRVPEKEIEEKCKSVMHSIDRSLTQETHAKMKVNE